MDASSKPDAVASERRLRDLLAHAWRHSPFYRELYAAHGIRERDLAHVPLADLPVVSKADLMVRFDEAVTDTRLRRDDLERWLQQDTDPLSVYLDRYIFVHGSGGTGIHSYVPYTPETWRRVTTAAAPLLLPLKQGVTPRLRSAFYFWSERHFVGAVSARLASHAAHELLSLSVFDPVEEVRARLNAFKPERLHSYASALSWLAEWTLQGKLRIAPRTVVSSGDRLTPAVRAQIEAAWNAEIYEVYGACESLCMAVQRPGAHFEVLAETNLLEVVDAANRMVQPGARGRVLLTSLVNATLPIIRFDLHDYAILGSAGLGAETLLRLEGKTYEALPVRRADGGLVALEVYELSQLELPGVVKLQCVAHSPDHVEIRYQSSRDMDASVGAAFRRLLAERSAAVETLTVGRVEHVANSMPAFKLQRAVKPDQALFAPVSLADGHSREAVPIAGAEPGPRADETDARGAVDRSFAEIAALLAQRCAVIDRGQQLSYGELDVLASRVAGALLGRGFDASRPVAVVCAHGLELLPLVLGTLRAGGFYLPLDPRLPRGRLQAILVEMRPELILCDRAQRDAARALAGDAIALLCLDDMRASPPQRGSPASPDAPACVLYTSGSSGASRGIVLSHRAMRQRAARYRADFDLRPADRVALLHSHAVSAGVRDVFGALLAGSTLAFYDVRERGVAGLARWLEDTRITVLYAVPTLFRTLLESLSTESFTAVRVLRLGGEPVEARDVDGFRRHFPLPCKLVNGYATTETDTICQYVIDRETRIVAGRIPVGTAVEGVHATLCDAQGDAQGDADDEALAEVRVAGNMLASGCWDARTGRVQPFDLPFATGDLGYRLADGRMFLAGRRDLIVKVHGYRVDLGEVERAASAVPGVVEAAAVLRAGRRNEPRLVVFYVATGEDSRVVAALRRAVDSIVPARAAATAFVRLPELPRLASGKVLRDSLPAVPRSAAEPRRDPGSLSGTEATVAHIWQEVLEVPCTTRGANFFDLGGDSITVFRVLSLIRRECGVDLPVGEFFAHVELSALARAIDARRASAPSAATPAR